MTYNVFGGTLSLTQSINLMATGDWPRCNWPQYFISILQTNAWFKSEVTSCLDNLEMFENMAAVRKT